MASRQNRSISLFRQAEAILRDQISEGVYPPGSKLPPEDELAQQLGVSRGTLRQAMGALERDGLVERHPGRGTFTRKDISSRRHAARLPARQSVPAAIDDAMRASRLVRFGLAVPPPHVGLQLGLSASAKTPFRISVSPPDVQTKIAVKHYWHPDMADRLDAENAQLTGNRDAFIPGDIWVDAILAEPRFAMMLKVAPGSPLLSLWWVDTLEGNPVRCSQMLKSGAGLALSVSSPSNHGATSSEQPNDEL